ncbi:hypothetical protein [Microbacter margulisiae]|uniref:Lipoprotein n=1 Tax=Microbacter margulisiae TaxID=1350067 RepID=A0A7W5DTU5_9PORP|nr:hypothetical protein [Microbacter margulisiae]MBB3188588.1 hypothetical protein [Microbacter margulisiae]
MKNIFVFILLTATISCNCQNKTELFKQFVNKFKECPFPITNETFRKMDLYANNPSNITKQEFDLFIKDKNDRYWIYMPYSKQHPDYFNYTTAIKIPLNINNNLIALIYFRSFLTAPSQGKSDAVLAVFSQQGTEISKTPILGEYEDTLDFQFRIYSPENIEINYTKYSDKGETKYTKYYYIQKDGKIVLRQ